MIRPEFRLTLAAALLLAAPLLGEQTRTFTASFPTGTPIRLATLAGTIAVEPSTAPAVEVEVTVHAEGRDAAETAQLLALAFVAARDDAGRTEQALSFPVETHATFHYPRADGGGDRHGFFDGLFAGLASSETTYRGRRVRVVRGPGSPTLWADLVVRMPRDADLALRTAVGAIRGGRLAGRLALDTGSGAVTLDRFDGDLTIDTGSGAIQLGALAGRGALDTGSGSVEVESVDAERLAIDTGSGSITVRDGRVAALAADTGSGRIELERVEFESLSASTGSGGVKVESSLHTARSVAIETGSGAVTIVAAPDAAFDLRADQGSGHLHVGYADAELVRAGHEVVGARRGSGGAVIRVDTGSGDCTLSPRG